MSNTTTQQQAKDFVSPDEDLDLEDQFNEDAAIEDDQRRDALRDRVERMVGGVQAYAHDASDADIDIVHQIIEGELHRRSLEGQGAEAFSLGYTWDRRAYRKEIKEAHNGVRRIVGGLTQCFEERDGGRIISEPGSRLVEEKGLRGNGMNKVVETVKLRDKNLGRNVYCRITCYVGTYADDSFRFVMGFHRGLLGREEKAFYADSAEELIHDFGQWVAKR